MEYVIVVDEACTIRLIFAGRLTFSDHVHMAQLVRKVVHGPLTRVVIDVSSLEFIDSVGIGMLMVLAEEVYKFGGRLTTENQRGQVARVLTTVQFDKFLKFL